MRTTVRAVIAFGSTPSVYHLPDRVHEQRQGLTSPARGRVSVRIHHAVRRESVRNAAPNPYHPGLLPGRRHRRARFGGPSAHRDTARRHAQQDGKDLARNGIDPPSAKPVTAISCATLPIAAPQAFARDGCHQLFRCCAAYLSLPRTAVVDLFRAVPTILLAPGSRCWR